mgnify:CR=1 FL=1
MFNAYIRIPALNIKEILAFCKELNTLAIQSVFIAVFMESAIVIINIYSAIFSSHKIETT